LKESFRKTKTKNWYIYREKKHISPYILLIIFGIWLWFLNFSLWCRNIDYSWLIIFGLIVAFFSASLCTLCVKGQHFFCYYISFWLVKKQKKTKNIGSNVRWDSNKISEPEVWILTTKMYWCLVFDTSWIWIR